MNVLVWGFEKCPEVFHISEDKQLIDVKIWVGEKKDYKKCTLEIKDLYDGKFLTTHNTKIIKDTKKITIYNSVYKKSLIKFLNMFSRTIDGEFKNFHENLDMFNIFFNYFYDELLKKNIKCMFFISMPHFGPDLILYSIAKELNIHTIMLSQSLFPNKFFYSYKIEDFGTFTHIQSKYCEPIKIEKQFKKELFYMKTLPKRKNCIKVFIGKVLKRLLRSKRLNTSLDIALNQYTKCKTFYKNSKNLPKKNINLNLNYVYFALHLQPELTTSAIGSKYADQILAIEHLTSFLPNDYFIYVKENPKQTYKERNNTFYKRLSLLDNVILVPPTLNTYDLIENSKFVATITGTVGYEALSGGKAVLVFGNPWYKSLHGVFIFNDTFNFDKIINFKISHELFQLSFDKLMLKSRDGLVDSVYKKIIPNFNNDQNIKYLTNFILEEIEKIKACHA